MNGELTLIIWERASGYISSLLKIVEISGDRALVETKLARELLLRATGHATYRKSKGVMSALQIVCRYARVSVNGLRAADIVQHFHKF
jgi:uncharacterized membrane protein